MIIRKKKLTFCYFFFKYFVHLDHYDTKEKEMACTWIDSSHDNLNISKENDFITFDDSGISMMPTILNSPPESVKSVSSYDDADCSNSLFVQNNNDIFEPEKSFDFVDNALIYQPIKNSQDFLYEGPNEFQQEIEQLSSLNMYNNENKMDLDEDNMIIEKKTPILGNDLMFSRLQQQPQITFNLNNSNVKNESNPDVNMNIIPINTAPAAKLLDRRTIKRSQLKLTLKMTPVESTGTYMNNQLVSTPQITKEVLEMEMERDSDFDLVNYINSDDVSITFY